MRERRAVACVVGPLAGYAQGFRGWLTERGYRPSSVEGQAFLMGHLSRWLTEEGLQPSAFSGDVVEEFRKVRRETHSHLSGARAIDQLLGYLRGLGVVPEPFVSDSSVDRLVAAYRAYLVSERGLVAGSVALRERVARLFLGELADPIDVALHELGPAHVTGFVVEQCGGGRRGVAWAKTLTSGLRSLLVFLHVAGWVAVPLVAAVPSVAGWRLSSLPRGLEREQVARLLASCDRTTGVSRRDFAILMLLARLGLRACEVTAMSLDDIDWRAGELTVHGKGAQTDRLPLPRDVGQALVDHLLGREPDDRFVRCSCARSRRMVRCLRRRSDRSCAMRVTGLGCRGSVRTGCGTRSQPTCWPRARRCQRSRRCCATRICRAPRSARRSTGQRCERSLVRGHCREPWHEPGRRGGGGLPAGAPRAWLQA
jgi:integrase/recombinase XerD